MNSATHPRSVSAALSLPWKRLLLPTEHGSWALTFEPVVLGLLVALSPASAWIAGAVAAGFIARKPAKLGWGASAAKSPAVHVAARRLAVALAALVCICLASAWALAGAWVLIPLALAAPGVAYFAWCDRTNRTRSLSAEMIGTGVCALPLVAMAFASGFSVGQAAAIGAIVVARALPTLLLVRTCLRRTREGNVSSVPTWVAHAGGVAVLMAAAHAGSLPWECVLINLLLVPRAAVFLFAQHPLLTARQIGMMETAIGVVYISLQSFVLVHT